MRTMFDLRRASALLLAAGICGAAPAAAQSAPASHFPSNEDLRHTRAVDDPQLSPDGRFVLATVAEPTVDGAQRHLWIVDVASGASRQLTFSPAGSKAGESRGRWSADGKSVFFVARRGDAAQLFQLPMAGGEAAPFDLKIVPLVDESREPDAVDGSRAGAAAVPAAIDVSNFSLSPNGDYAAIVARDPTTSGEKKQRTDKADAQWVDHDMHAERLYLLDLHSGAPRRPVRRVWPQCRRRWRASSGRPTIRVFSSQRKPKPMRRRDTPISTWCRRRAERSEISRGPLRERSSPP
jgi:dipeptidyl aminopeptidase/acylaminoacyl peptidase